VLRREGASSRSKTLQYPPASIANHAQLPFPAGLGTTAGIAPARRIGGERVKHRA
jgi:hypothetical protein